MRVPYKSRQILKPRKAFPQDTVVWRPVLPVRIVCGSEITQWFDAIVDSGADVCLFDLSIARRLNVRLEESAAERVGILGSSGIGYPAVVKILVGVDSFETTVIFFEDLPVAGLLGRKGFFDSFIVTFDHLTKPPSLVYERITRPS